MYFHSTKYLNAVKIFKAIFLGYIECYNFAEIRISIIIELLFDFIEPPIKLHLIFLRLY